MTKSQSSSWKWCVTCQCWGGTRKTSVFRDRVEYASDQDKGECIGGGWNRSQQNANSTCNSWEKWSVLK